jgi:hypothetical protein
MERQMISFPEVQELLGRWWCAYDEARFAELASLLTEDAHFTVRTDTGATEYEDFVNANVRGVREVMEWQIEHRFDSPSPLRHNGANLHLTGTEGRETFFASYIFVTYIVQGEVSNLSTGTVTGSARSETGRPRLSSLHVVLDTENSRPLGQIRSSESPA